MLRRNLRLRTQIHQWLDGGIFALALWVAYGLRAQGGAWFGADPIAPFSPNYLVLFLAIIPIAPLVLESQGFYKRSALAQRRQMAWQLLKSCAISAIGLILVLFALHFDAAARGVIVLFGAMSFCFIYLKEELLKWAAHSQLGLAQLRRRVVLIGTPEDTQRMRHQIKEGDENLEIQAEFDLNAVSLSEIVSFLHQHSINGVILTAKHTYFGQVEKAIQACELEGIEAWLIADFFKTQISRTTLDDFYGRPVLVFSSAPAVAWSGLAKQIIDVTGALLLLFVLGLPMILAAIAVRLSSPGPVFFKQQRAGVNGKPFTMYKFRSMVTNAEQMKQELAALNEMSGPVFKITKDPRITPVGRWLRKFSIDEFPQIFNVLRCEMSLVGPRPLPVEEVARFDDVAQRRRLSVRPGLTCLWQVSGRNDVSDFKEWVRLDLQYIDNWSLWLDFKILWRTIPVVLFGKGAR